MRLSNELLVPITPMAYATWPEPDRIVPGRARDKQGLQLSNVLCEFARTMVVGLPIQAILEQLVKRTAEVLPGMAAGVTLLPPRSPTGHRAAEPTVSKPAGAGSAPVLTAASSEAALQYELLLGGFEYGPCQGAWRTGAVTAVPDLDADPRFDGFWTRAAIAAVAGAFSFSLHHGDEALGALTLYSPTRGPLPLATMAAAQTLADVAAAYIFNAQCRSALAETTRRAVDASLHDALTGLPNRVLIIEHLELALRRARRPGNTVGVLFIDIDHFKQVNDVYGHRCGDELLIAAGRRMAQVLRPGDTLGRLSGDEFVAVCEDIEDPTEAAAIADRIAIAIEVPFELSNALIATTASVGIAFSRDGSGTAEDLLQEADLAMYEAKRRLLPGIGKAGRGRRSTG